MNRRSFLGRTILGLVALSMPVVMTGCNVFNDLLNWIPVGLSAISGILSLLSGGGVVLGPGITAIIALIQAGLTDLKLAIVEYQSTTPPPAGALAKIDTFLSDLVSNIGNVLSQLPPQPANLITLVIGLFELLLSTIQGFINKVPMAAQQVPKTAAVLKRAMVGPGGKAIVIAPRTNLSRRAFIHDYNRLAEAGGHSEVKLHESLVQHL